MIQERAQVISISGDNVVVQTSGQKSCVKCSNGTGCGLGTLQTFFGRKNHALSATTSMVVQQGDMVIIEVPERAILVSACLMYLLPVVSMLVAAFFIKTIAPASGELLQIVAAFVGLAAGIFLSTRLAKRFFKHGRFEPKVVAQCLNR